MGLHHVPPSEAFKTKMNKEVLGVVVRSYYLGIFYAVGSHLVDLEIVNHYQNLGAFMKILAFFHYSEFLFTALSNPQNLGLKSFVLNHWGSFEIGGHFF